MASHLCRVAFRLLLTFGLFASRTLSRLLSVVASLAFTLLVHPIRAVWRSPAASLLLSAIALSATFAVHTLGAWPLLANTASAIPSQLLHTLGYAARASCSWLSNLLLMGLHTAFRLASAASEPMLALVPSAVAGASRHVLSSTEAHMASIDSAYVSAGKLHAEPSFATCIWLLFAVIVRASPTLPPPRALAAVQLGVVLHFYQGSARWLPLVALLTLGYLLLAAHAEARARREQHAARSAVRELREGTTSPLS